MREESTKFKYSNKVDIWALGCIFFEVVFAQKAFTNDISVVYFSSMNDREIPISTQTSFDGDFLPSMWTLISTMLSQNPSMRPRATNIRETLNAMTNSQPQMMLGSLVEIDEDMLQSSSEGPLQNRPYQRRWVIAVDFRYLIILILLCVPLYLMHESRENV